MKSIFFKDCSDLWIYNFDQIVETNNYAYLIRDYDIYSDVPDFDIEKAKKLWDEIYEQFCKLSDNPTAILYYETLSELGWLKVRKYHVTILLGQFSLDKSDRIIDMYIDALSRWKFFINKKNSLEVELKKMQKQLRAADNRIGLKESELKLMREDEIEPMSLVKQAIKLAQGLKKEKIDTKTTTVEQWLALVEELRTTNEHRNKGRNAA